jgi:serine/threonine protein kinase
MRSGRYEIGERIGSGGMAEVFRATYVGEGGIAFPVAIKRIHPHLSKDRAFVEGFMHEAEIASRIKAHKNIVAVKELGRDEEDRLFLAMELVEGKNLRELTERWTALPASVCVFIACEVLRALRHAHTLVDRTGRPESVVHRDVSPHNILISYDGSVKLADFGIAKGLHTMSSTGNAIKGKAAYMSPEQANGEKLDAQSDLFSVGTILHELLTGERLFSGPHIQNDAVVLDRIRRMEVKSPKTSNHDLSDNLARACLRLLEKDKLHRFSSAEDALVALLDCAESSPKSEEQLREMIRARFQRDRIAPRARANGSDGAPPPDKRAEMSTDSTLSRRAHENRVAGKDPRVPGAPVEIRGRTIGVIAMAVAVGVTAILVRLRSPSTTDHAGPERPAETSDSTLFPGTRDRAEQPRVEVREDQPHAPGARDLHASNELEHVSRPLKSAEPDPKRRESMARGSGPRGSRSNSGTSKSVGFESLNLNVGDRFKARLEMTINSSVDAPIIASVEETVEREGERILRLGDLLRGHASSDDDRIYVRFDSVETRDGLRSIHAVARYHDADGLPAEHRESARTGSADGSVRLTPRTTQVGGDPERKTVLEVSPGIVFDVIVVDDSSR